MRRRSGTCGLDFGAPPVGTGPCMLGEHKRSAKIVFASRERDRIERPPSEFVETALAMGKLRPGSRRRARFRQIYAAKPPA